MSRAGADRAAPVQRRMSPAARREQIVGAARSVIVRQGLTTTSLRDIAAEAGVSMGTVTYHFGGIDEILGAVVVAESARYYDVVIASADAEPDPRAALRVLIEPLFPDDGESDDHWRIWTDYWATVARRPEVADSYAGRIRHWERCCTRTIARGIAEGVFREVDPADAALKLAAYSDGLATQRAQGVDRLTPALARTWFLQFADALLTP